MWDQLVFTLLNLRLIANHCLTKKPCDAKRLTVGHLEEGRSLGVVKTCYIYFLKSLFHLEIVSLVINYESSYLVLW